MTTHESGVPGPALVPNTAPVPKGVRYDVLRRDNFACRYCGRPAPDVILEVDHVIPRADGGSNDPSNLVAACEDCNRGKSASSPDPRVVVDVAQRELEWSMGRRAVEEARRATTEARVEHEDALLVELHRAMYADCTEYTEIPEDIAGRPGVFFPLDAPVWFMCEEDAQALPLLKAGVAPAHFKWLADVYVSRHGRRDVDACWVYVRRWARVEADRIKAGDPRDSVEAALR